MYFTTDVRENFSLWKLSIFKVIQDDLSLEELPKNVISLISEIKGLMAKYFVGMNDIVRYEFHTENDGFYWHECEVCGIPIIPFNSVNGITPHILTDIHRNNYFRKYNISKIEGTIKEKENLLDLINEYMLARKIAPRICYDLKDISVPLIIRMCFGVIDDPNEWFAVMKENSKAEYERKRAINSLVYADVKAFIKRHNEHDKREREERILNGVMSEDADDNVTCWCGYDDDYNMYFF